MRILTLVASALAASALSASALEYAPTLELATINLMDEATKIGEIQSIFVDDVTLVSLSGIEWVLLEDEGTNVTEQGNLVWETAVNGVVESTGTIDLSDTIDRDLPTDIEAGSIVVKSKQTAEVSVKIYLEDKVIVTSSQTSKTYQAYGRGVSIVPLVMILFLAMTTKMVELSLFLGIWLGSCILTGSLAGGFTMTLDTFLLEALTNEGHVFVILFSVFLSGLVGMLQKSGGMLGFTNLCTKYSKTPRAGQFACMLLGVIVFFDDYANVLLTGETMKPLLDVLFVSREKLSFIVDATSAPIASIAPISSWVGYEAGLVNDALVELKKRNGGEALTIPETGFGVFLQSIRYSYYSWFMLGLIAMLIISQRDYGPMLIAERKVRVYDRTDGGDGANNSGKSLENKANEPEKDQPLLIHNMLIPIVVWIILVFTILVDSGDDGSGSQSFLEKIESGDSYVALLYGTMGTVWVTIILYMLQITIPGTGKLALPTPSVLLDMMPWRKATVEQRGDQQPRFVLTIYESVESFLYGMTRIFLAIVVLTLAWACGSIMVSVGVDRLFASWITGGAIPYQIMPTLTFVIALLMALSTGTSWTTMAILYPLILVPTYEVSDGDPEIFYATVSAVLGGAVAGDHMSPISDTTVLTSLACDVNLMKHVNTQAPYVFWVVIFSILLGYLPVGYSGYPNIVGILLGWVACALFVYFVCAPVLSPTGHWDVVTKLTCGRSETLQDLAADCAKKANGESLDEKVRDGSADSEESLKKEIPESSSPMNEDEEQAV